MTSTRGGDLAAEKRTETVGRAGRRRGCLVCYPMVRSDAQPRLVIRLFAAALAAADLANERPVAATASTTSADGCGDPRTSGMAQQPRSDGVVAERSTASADRGGDAGRLRGRLRRRADQPVCSVYAGGVGGVRAQSGRGRAGPARTTGDCIARIAPSVLMASGSTMYRAPQLEQVTCMMSGNSAQMCWQAGH